MCTSITLTGSALTWQHAASHQPVYEQRQAATEAIAPVAHSLLFSVMKAHTYGVLSVLGIR